MWLISTNVSQVSQQIDYKELWMAKLGFKESTKYTATVKVKKKINLWVTDARIRTQVAGQD